MHRAKGLTLSVRNLPPETTKRDVEGYFNGVISGAEPFVGSLVKDSQIDALCATVTLNDEAACKKACKDLNGRPVWAARGHGSYDIRVEQSYLGITPLAEHKDPEFDYYFLHGLGGHAFETFAGPIKRRKHAEQKMWARDLLPERFAKAGLHGRFSTLGYNANVVGGAGTTTIDSAAKDLLHQLSLDRPEGCQRPIFFVAHSLGGLVVCQALILSLDDDDEDPAAAERFKLHGLVRGIVFMGTPFWGSFTANALKPFVSALERVNPFPVNSGLIENLKANSGDLASLVGHFGQLRKQHNIDIRVFYETLPLTSSLFSVFELTGQITRPDSAAATLREFVDPVSMNGTHSSIVKFGHSEDPNFRNIAGHLLRLTQKHIGGGELVKSSTFQTRPPSYSFHSNGSTDSDNSGMGALSDGFAQLHTSPDRKSSHGQYSQQSPPLRPLRSDTAPSRTSSAYISPTRQSPSRSPSHHHRPSSSYHHLIQSQPSKIEILQMPDYTSISGPENMRNLARIANWDIVFVIDDTNSMDTAADSVAASKTDQRVTTRWDVLVRGMQYIADIAAKYDEDGVDVYFLCSTKLNKPNVQDGQQILDQLGKVILENNTGGTYFEKALSPILSQYIQAYKPYYEGRIREAPKPMNVIVLTDGAADDGLQTEKLLVRVAQALDDMWAPSFQLGIQFVQVGDEEKATKYLKMLDDRLETKHGIRDMIDTTHFVHTEDGLGLGNKILKILLGAMDKALDNDEEGPSEEEPQGVEDDPYRTL